MLLNVENGSAENPEPIRELLEVGKWLFGVTPLIPDGTGAAKSPKSSSSSARLGGWGAKRDVTPPPEEYGSGAGAVTKPPIRSRLVASHFTGFIGVSGCDEIGARG